MENTNPAVLKNQPKVRYALLDELRGFMVLCMVFYHAFFTFFEIFNIPVAEKLFNFFAPAEPVFAGGFIFLSGLMCGFSRSNIKRGVITLFIALGITAATVMGADYFGDIQIYFGILHLLGTAMLFCGLLDPVLKFIPKWIGFILNIGLFIGLYGVADNNYNLFGIQNVIPSAWHSAKWMFIFGITNQDFYSADYFPIIPWLFLFIAGYYLVKTGFIQKGAKIFLPSRIKPLQFLGRHAMIIYILHQPVIYGLFYLADFIKTKIG